METAEYTQKGFQYLEDSYTYIRINSKVNNKKIENMNKTLIHDWARKRLINDKTVQYLAEQYTINPRMYFLSKIHKVNFPVRPIVLSLNSPSHRTAKLIHNLIKPITEEHFSNIKNSVEFAN